MGIHPFIVRTAELLDAEGIPISPFSGLDAICIDIPVLKARIDIGTVWIEGLDGQDEGMVVIRVNSEMVRLHLLPRIAKKLIEKAIPLLENKDTYNISLRTMTFHPDLNEPENAPTKYTLELRLERKAASPEDAVREIKKILNMPVEALENLLRRIKA
jgi:hypothetical protein